MSAFVLLVRAFPDFSHLFSGRVPENKSEKSGKARSLSLASLGGPLASFFVFLSFPVEGKFIIFPTTCLLVGGRWRPSSVIQAL